MRSSMGVSIIFLSILLTAERSAPTVIEESSLGFPSVAHADVPLYPPIARVANVDGVVKVKVTTDGHRVVNTEVEPNANPLLARAAQENLRSWEFAVHEAASFTVTYRYMIVDDIDARQENPTVVLKLPTEVEVRVLRWPKCNLPKIDIKK